MTVVKVEPSVYGLDGWIVHVIVPAKAGAQVSDRLMESPNVTVNIGATVEAPLSEVFLESCDPKIGTGWTVPVTASHAFTHFTSPDVTVLDSRVGACAQIAANDVGLSSPPVSIRIPSEVTPKPSKVSLNSTGPSVLLMERRARFYRRRPRTRLLAPGEVVAKVL